VGPALDDLRRVTGTDGFRAGCRYEGTDAATLLRLAGAGHGLTLLPASLLPASPLAGVAAVAVSAPRLVHRVELVHGTLPAGSPAAALTALLT
jgi:DNA-binding transcriptional LysR family regulator